MVLDLEAALARHAEAVAQVAAAGEAITALARRLRQVLEDGGRVFVCGNGGSAADAQHFASELVGRYLGDRGGYPAVALTTDSSALTAIGNDFGFERVFARQLEALAAPGDLLLAISTSGGSPNVLEAVRCAAQMGLHTAALTGGDGGRLAAMADTAIVIGVPETPRVQEAHILVLHLLCEAFEPA